MDKFLFSHGIVSAGSSDERPCEDANPPKTAANMQRRKQALSTRDFLIDSHTKSCILRIYNLSVYLSVKAAKVNTKSKPAKNSKEVNPFIKLIEDKLKISEAIQKEDSLSTLKDIHFVKPL